ncbi:MAG: hypothetical protein U0R19_06105 [Bryobacteraceae bacterium]
MSRPKNKPFVFINCPFDPFYRPLFERICFTLLCCGYIPRCSLEDLNSGIPRLEKLIHIIPQCPLGIHDLTRTQTGINQLPRFNMPFELGLYLGSRVFGARKHPPQQTLILVKHPHQYQAFISDIAGNDPLVYTTEDELVARVYDWLQSLSSTRLPGPRKILRAFCELQTELPAYRRELGLDVDALSFNDFVYLSRHLLARYTEILSHAI